MMPCRRAQPSSTARGTTPHRARRAVRPGGPAQLSRVRRALRISHRALSRADARTQRQGRTGRCPLRQAERPGRPRLPRRPRRQSPSPAVVPRDRGSTDPRHDQGDPARDLRSARARGAAPTPALAVGARRVEASQAPRRLSRRLRRRLLLGTASLDRGAALGAGRRQQDRAVPRLHLDRHPSARASGPAADRRRALAAREGPLPYADPRVVSRARRRDRPRLRAVHRCLARRSPPRSASQCPGRPPLRRPLRRRARRRRPCPRARRRPIPLPHHQGHPRPRARSAAAARAPSRRDGARDHAAASRPSLDHLLPRPRTGRQEVTRMELTHQLAPMLRTLRLSGILETLDVRNRQAVEQQSSFVEFLTLLLQDEVERRAQSKLRLRLRRAAFDPTKTLEGFDFSFNPKLNKAQVFDLATGQFIARLKSVLVYGPTGVGKSHLAQALAHEACRRGYEVLFVATDKMLTHLAGDRADGTREARLARYTRPDLLVLDDFGLKPLRAPGPEDLYDVINERYERGSILVTSNRDRAEWPELFGEPLLASARSEEHTFELQSQSNLVCRLLLGKKKLNIITNINIVLHWSNLSFACAL